MNASAEAKSPLPPGWAWTTLGDCVEILDGQRVPVNRKERELRMGTVPYYGATGQVGWIDDFLFDEELVLLGEDGVQFLDALKQKAYLIKGKSWVNNHAHVLRAVAGLMLNGYMLNYLNAFDYHGYVTGTTRLKLPQSPMRRIPLPLPPANEQRRIVAKIEELFSKLDAGVAELVKAKAQLKRYRQSVLKAAFEGKLTERWRRAHPKTESASVLLDRIREARKRKLGPKYKEPPPLDTSDLPELPEGWVWARLDRLAALAPRSITDGPFGSNLKTSHYNDSGPRVIRLQNIGDGEFLDARAHISLDHFASLRKHEILAGDLAIAALGDVLPRACIVPASVGPAIVKADCIRFHPNQAATSSKYLHVVLNSEPLRHLVKETIHGVGRPRLNQQQVKALPVPLPPRAEQEAIVEETDRLESYVRSLNRAVEGALKHSAGLRQAILKHAFEGKLVPQDPSDPPASELLERIKAEKARLRACLQNRQAAKGTRGQAKRATTRKAGKPRR